MADTPTSTSSQERDAQDLNFELRRVLGNSYNFVLGQQATQSFSAVTYEELAQDQITRIEGPGTPARPNELERVNNMEQDMLEFLEKVRDIPPDQFLLKDSTTDVNTPVEPEEEEE